MLNVREVNWDLVKVEVPLNGSLVDFGLLPTHGGLFSVRGEVFVAGSLEVEFGWTNTLGALFFLMDRMVGECPWDHCTLNRGLLVVQTLTEQHTLILREQLLMVLRDYQVYLDVVNESMGLYGVRLAVLSRDEIQRFVDFLEGCGGLVYVQRGDGREGWTV